MGRRGGNGNAEWPTEACRQFDARLEGYLEGDQQPFITAHAAACGHCGAVLADVLLLQSAAGDLKPEEPPIGLWSSLKAKLTEEGIIRWPREACRLFDTQLQNQLEGLEGNDQPDLGTHASECEYCGAVLADLVLLRTAAGEFEHEEPPARVWANVRASLLQEGLIRPVRSRAWAWAHWLWRPIPAAALATVLALVAVFLHSRPQPHPNLPLQAAASVPVDPGVKATVAQMEHAFRVQSAALDPRIRLAYDKGLDTLDGEIRDCEATLARQPGDSLTREYLTSAYNEKAEVLASALEFGDTNVR